MEFVGSGVVVEGVAHTGVRGDGEAMWSIREFQVGPRKEGGVWSVAGCYGQVVVD